MTISPEEAEEIQAFLKTNPDGARMAHMAESYGGGVISGMRARAFLENLVQQAVTPPPAVKTPEWDKFADAALWVTQEKGVMGAFFERAINALKAALSALPVEYQERKAVALARALIAEFDGEDGDFKRMKSLKSKLKSSLSDDGALDRSANAALRKADDPLVDVLRWTAETHPSPAMRKAAAEKHLELVKRAVRGAAAEKFGPIDWVQYRPTGVTSDAPLAWFGWDGVARSQKRTATFVIRPVDASRRKWLLRVIVGGRQQKIGRSAFASWREAKIYADDLIDQLDSLGEILPRDPRDFDERDLADGETLDDFDLAERPVMRKKG